MSSSTSGWATAAVWAIPTATRRIETTLLGKVVRIVPTPDEPEPYRIPPDNPFVDEPGVAPEIWVMGVRNPFRMSADPDTGDLWLGDVGQSCWEELDRLPTGADDAGGANLGWDHVEGSHPFEGGTVPGRELGPCRSTPTATGGAGSWPAMCSDPRPYRRWTVGSSTRTTARATWSRWPSTGARADPRQLDTGLEVENPIADRARPDREPVDPHPRW